EKRPHLPDARPCRRPRRRAARRSGRSPRSPPAPGQHPARRARGPPSPRAPAPPRTCTGAVPRRSFTKVPFVEPRSSTNHAPSRANRRAWLCETYESSSDIVLRSLLPILTASESRNEPTFLPSGACTTTDDGGLPRCAGFGLGVLAGADRGARRPATSTATVFTAR